jgi:hypothetical protein
MIKKLLCVLVAVGAVHSAFGMITRSQIQAIQNAEFILDHPSDPKALVLKAVLESAPNKAEIKARLISLGIPAARAEGLLRSTVVASVAERLEHHDDASSASSGSGSAGEGPASSSAESGGKHTPSASEHSSSAEESSEGASSPEISLDM